MALWLELMLSAHALLSLYIVCNVTQDGLAAYCALQLSLEMERE